MCPIDVYYEPNPPTNGATGANEGSEHWGTIEPGNMAMQLRCARVGFVVVQCDHEDNGGAIFSRSTQGTEDIRVFTMASDGTSTEFAWSDGLTLISRVPTNSEVRFATYTPEGSSYGFRAVHTKR